jgi:hypothetical protein
MEPVTLELQEHQEIMKSEQPVLIVFVTGDSI